MDILPSLLDEFHKSPMEFLGALAAVTALCASFLKPVRQFGRRMWAALRSKPFVPSETLRIIPDEQNSFWAHGRIEEAAATQLNFDGHVTDISGREVHVLRVEIEKPSAKSVMVSISNHHDARRPQYLEPHETADIRVMFMVQPVVGIEGKPWKATLIFIDQYGNRHKVKNCEFRALVSGAPAPPPEPEEFPYQIIEPVQKEVVSVLKAELSRYNVCGRSCGGLGSVHIVYRGNAFPGVGGDSWRPNSPENQLIAPDPEAASLQSDNLQSLTDFYKGLSGDEERDGFRQALLERLDRNRGYQAVSYFIVLALWRVGSLREALDKAKRGLPENESRFFGLSNVLMLINGLLRYRHPEFDNIALDEIERLTHGLKEHTFLIPAKISAIRAARLKGRQSPPVK